MYYHLTDFNIGDKVISETDLSCGNVLIIKEKDKVMDSDGNTDFMFYAESPEGTHGEWLFYGEIKHA